MKIGISLKDEVVKVIDAKAAKMGISRSAFIAMAISEKMRQDDVLDNMPEILNTLRNMKTLVEGDPRA